MISYVCFTWQIGAGHHLHFQTRTRVKQERKDNQAADKKMRQQGVAALRKTLRQVRAVSRPSHTILLCWFEDRVFSPGL